MVSPYLYWPPLSPGSSTASLSCLCCLSDISYLSCLSCLDSLDSLDDWFVIAPATTHVSVTEVDADSDSDSSSDNDFVLVDSGSDTESEIVYFLPPQADAHGPVRPPTPDLLPPPQPTVSVILNARKVPAPGFHADAELAFGDHWSGYDSRIRRQMGVMRYTSCRRRECFYHVFSPNRQTSPTPTKCLREPPTARMTIRVVDAAEELARRLASEAGQPWPASAAEPPEI
ncbi:hypothetical protein CcaverHIS002_0200170 [Cutaneotrichosporon cavernicola]|nr:hypothetical protein CcaverHIS002_0200170 [Cutaneotrichosporon cavernicola]BEI96434.1 hypothetical protein CcaverHIS631_0200230 [Cutaneotrichosporon cavernicola]BEJ04206.1 hypothetical protein CcaverHIS641_0200230 [Cutaneotrichosporon cavernicola]